MEIVVFLIITIHLFFGLVFCGGPLVALAEPFRATSRSWQVVKDQLMHSIFFGLITLVAGCLLIAVLWDDRMAAVFSANHSRLIFLCMEFVFSIALVWSVCQFVPNPPEKTWAKWLTAAVLFIAATNSIYHFPSLMVVFREIRTEIAAEEIVKSHYKEYLFNGPILSKWIHVMMASISITAVWNRLNTAWDGISDSKATIESCGQLNNLDKRQSKWIFVGVALSWFSGFFALKASGYIQLLDMTGGKPVPSILLAVGIVLSFVLVLRNLPRNWDVNAEETKPVGMAVFDRILDLVMVLLLLFFMVQAVDRSSVPA